MAKKSKSQKRSKRRKLLKSIKEFKKRIPTCKGGYAFKSPRDYDRKDNKKVVDKELNDWYSTNFLVIDVFLVIYDSFNVFSVVH